MVRVVGNDMKDKIEKGQVWSYRTRKGEEHSLLTIIDIQNLSNSKIAHVSIDGIEIKDFKTGDVLSYSISHLPIDLEILKVALRELKFYTEISENEGYLYWKAEYEKGKAGIWSIDIVEVIEMTERSSNDG